MRVFISWSGEKSKTVALLLKSWLPVVIQTIEEPWCSDTDIESGANWSATIGEQLSSTEFGIICVTKENQNRPWLNFEAGAISKLVSNAAPVLIDFESKSDLQAGPMSSLQVTMLDRAGVEKLLNDINKKAERPLSDQVLRTSFERNYPQLEHDLAQIRSRDFGGDVPPRTEEDKVSEILTLTREMVSKLSQAIGGDSSLPRQAIPSLAPPPDGQHDHFSPRMVEAIVLDQLEALDVDPSRVTLSWPTSDLLRIRMEESVDNKKETVIQRLLQRRFPSLDFEVRKPRLPPRALNALRQDNDSRDGDATGLDVS